MGTHLSRTLNDSSHPQMACLSGLGTLGATVSSCSGPELQLYSVIDLKTSCTVASITSSCRRSSSFLLECLVSQDTTYST